MIIKKVVIENFKNFKGRFELPLNESLNIIVGNNGEGKSTIIESIHLALTGLLNGRYLKNELSQYLFNNEVERKYLESLSGTPIELPHILIELYFKDDENSDLQKLKGNGNSSNPKEDVPGVIYKIEFDDEYNKEYEDLLDSGTLKTLPIEYYKVVRKSFARNSITSKSIPIKSSLIDSSNVKFQNGSDMYISQIIKNNLTNKEKAQISQIHRNLKEQFKDNSNIKLINENLNEEDKFNGKEISISVDMSTQNAWESSLMTYLENVPFHYIGKGDQSIVKTLIALNHDKTEESNIILLEEPENHLTHSKLNELMNDVNSLVDNKQFIVSTHSSFVANKLGLNNLILLNNQQKMSLSELDKDTYDFFKKLPGYDLLRMLLCKNAILVEGDCDELMIQRAYKDIHGKLPIEDGVDVISVGLSFLRFLSIAEKLNKQVTVVTDNDGDLEALEKKYFNYLGANEKKNIKICFDSNRNEGEDKEFNYNTLEPNICYANDLTELETILGTKYKNQERLIKYMVNNKTKVSLKIFESDSNIHYPKYIKESLES